MHRAGPLIRMACRRDRACGQSTPKLDSRQRVDGLRRKMLIFTGSPTENWDQQFLNASRVQTRDCHSESDASEVLKTRGRLPRMQLSRLRGERV